tara:strand:- start:216 stop:1325 length:1110 start_codon:yes stop_codon:yes gene_type:complete
MGEYLERPEIVSSIITDTKTQQEAREVANSYMNFVIAGHEYFHGGSDKANEHLDKFYDGYKVDKELSDKNHQVFIGNNNVIINYISTQSVQTALKNWEDAASKEQKPIVSGLLNVGKDIYEGFKSIVQDKFENKTTRDIFALAEKYHEIQMKNTLNLEERFEDGREILSRVNSKYPTSKKLLTGYSLGGLVAKKTAGQYGVNAIIYNSAIGKDVIHTKNRANILEFRTSADIVSGLRVFEKEPDYKQFTLYPQFTDVGSFAVDNYYVAAAGDRDPFRAHMIERFAKDEKHYRKVLSGAIKLKSKPKKEAVVYVPTTRTHRTIQSMVERKRTAIINSKSFFPMLDLYNDPQNIRKLLLRLNRPDNYLYGN